jgi:CopG family nickel-responsive transcriptional regulator
MQPSFGIFPVQDAAIQGFCWFDDSIAELPIFAPPGLRNMLRRNLLFLKYHIFTSSANLNLDLTATQTVETGYTVNRGNTWIIQYNQYQDDIFIILHIKFCIFWQQIFHILSRILTCHFFLDSLCYLFYIRTTKWREPVLLTRFGVSVDRNLIKKFDQLMARKGYTNGSEAIRDLFHDSLVQAEWKAGSEETVGTVTIVYNRHTRELSDGLTQLQHRYSISIISTTHVHLDEPNCLEVLILPSLSLQGVNVGPDKVYNFRQEINPI